MKKFFSGLALLTVVILLASCQDDLFDWGNSLKLSKNEIAFRVGNDVATTRAEVQRTVVAPSNIYELPVTDDGQQFCLTETVTSLDEEVFNTFDGAVTRGTPIYTENFTKVKGYDGFYAIAFDGSKVASGNTGAFTVAESSIPRTETEYQSLNDDSWGSRGLQWFAPIEGKTRIYSHDYGEDDHNLAWPNELFFYLQAPQRLDTLGVSNIQYMKNGTIEFDYQSPLAREDSARGPQHQRDILFTTKRIPLEDKDKDNMVLFYHALTGVKFKVGKPSTHNIHVDINKVTLIQHQSYGHCTITPNYVVGTNTSENNPSNKTGAANTKSAACVKWTNLANPMDYTVDFSKFIKEVDGKQQLMNGSEQYDVEFSTNDKGEITGITDGDFSYFPESFFAAGNGGKNDYYKTVSTADGNFNNATYEYTFFMLPQPLGSAGVTMEIEYSYWYGTGHYITEEKHTNVAHVKISDPNAAWNAGELHTYYLTSEGVYIDVEDEVDGDLKKSLTIANTGTFAQYQRALMYGNWVYTDKSKDPENHLIVASADLLKNGTFTDFPGTNWTLATDGFYYYKNPIDVGNKPNTPLFNTYTGPDITPFSGTHLEFDINAQAIRYSYRSYNTDGSVIENDVTYVEDYNKEFVIDSWDLDKIYVVNIAANGDTTHTSQTVAAWMGLTPLTGKDPQPETFTGTAKK